MRRLVTGVTPPGMGEIDCGDLCLTASCLRV